MLACFYVCLAYNWSSAMDEYPTKPSWKREPNKFCPPGQTPNEGMGLTCIGYNRVPTSNNTSVDYKTVQFLILENVNNIPTLETGEFINAQFSSVEIITLTNCKIRSIKSGAFRDLKELKALYLNGNRIESLNMEMFENNDKLQFLLLGDNPIHHLIGTQFPRLPSLRYMRLGSGRLKEIPANTFEQLANLEKLYLTNNTLRRLDWTTLQNLTKLGHIGLDDNEWECDCHMRLLQSFLLNERKINISSTIICKGPEKFANLSLSEVPENELTCSSQITGNEFLFWILFIVSVILIATAVLIFVLAWTKRSQR